MTKKNDRIALRLNEKEDADIIEFLDGKPVTYIVKLALRRFMNESNGVLNEVPTKSVPEEKAEADDVKGMFGGFSK